MDYLTPDLRTACDPLPSIPLPIHSQDEIWETGPAEALAARWPNAVTPGNATCTGKYLTALPCCSIAGKFVGRNGGRISRLEAKTYKHDDSAPSLARCLLLLRAVIVYSFKKHACPTSPEGAQGWTCSRVVCCLFLKS